MNALILGTFALLSTLAQGADRICTAQLPDLWTAELEAVSAAVSALPLQPKESRGTVCDPFDPKLKARTGLQKGKFIDTKIKRNLMYLTDGEIAEFIGEKRSGHQYVANLYHDDRFWIAELPVDLKVNRLIYQSEEFLLGLTHGMMRVDLESPIRLYPQPSCSGSPAREPTQISNLTFTTEAAPVVGDKFNPAAGLATFRTSHYGTAVRVLSTSQSYKESITELGHKTTQLELTQTTPEMRKSVLDALIRHSVATQVNEPFELGWNNCMINLMEAIDQGLQHHYTPEIRNSVFPPEGRDREAWSVPMKGERYFLARRLVARDQPKLPRFNDEFQFKR
jgi:hypothetical protein